MEDVKVAEAPAAMEDANTAEAPAAMEDANATEAPAAQRKPPSFSDGTLSNAMVSVSVGADGNTFVTNLDLLCYWSPKFRDLLQGYPTQLKLLDVSPRVLGIFLDWMRSEGNDLPDWVMHSPSPEKFEEPKEVDDSEVLEDPDGYYRKQPEAEALDCYIFAHKYGIRLFMNDLFDSIHEMMNPDAGLVPSYSVVLKIWDNLPPTSPMRKYVVDVFTRNWTYETDIGYREELILRKKLPGTFWVPILKLRDEHGVPDDYPPWEDNLCQYHDHDEADRKECYWQNIGPGHCSDEEDEEDEEMEEGVDDKHPYGTEGIDNRSDDEISVCSSYEHESEMLLAEMTDAEADSEG